MKSTLILQSSKQPYGTIESFSFPGGERHVRLPEAALTDASTAWTITALIYSSEGVMDLLLLTDALRRAVSAGSQIHLRMPYTPYARQDRVALPGEPLSAAVFCKLINSLGFASVTIDDPHSDVTPALLENVRVAGALDHVRALLCGALADQQVALVAPDAGARKRVGHIAEVLGLPMVYASKKRDPATGKLSGAAIDSPVPDQPLLIVDDICDGGGTFISLAQALREVTQQRLYLYVTHGLFTKGLEPLLAVFDGVYAAHCADPAADAVTSLT